MCRVIAILERFDRRDNPTSETRNAVLKTEKVGRWQIGNFVVEIISGRQ